MKTPGESVAALPPIPFLKWAGGKRWLAPRIQKSSSVFSGKYIEPFIGSGAIYFSLEPRRALISDVNAALIETYQCVRDYPQEISILLAEHDSKHGNEYYYKIRSLRPCTPLGRAAQFIYLNRTCWNGLYRVNQRGEFNVPKGTKKSAILKTDQWLAVAQLLTGAQIVAQDFERTVDSAASGDLIFADPPYTVKHNLNGFIKYNECLFKWDDQIRLRDALVRAKNRGVKIIATNADHSSVRDLYRDGFELATLSRASVLSGDASFRGRFNELLITTNHD